MKIIKQEKVQKSYYDVYVANDGTEFSDRDECKKYEESALGVMMAKIKPLIIEDISEEGIIGFGNCDDTIWVMKPQTQNDVDCIMQTYLVIRSWAADNEHKDMLERQRKLAQRALDENDVLFVGRGYECDDFWFYGTCNSMKEKLDKHLNVEKKNDNA